MEEYDFDGKNIKKKVEKSHRKGPTNMQEPDRMKVINLGPAPMNPIVKYSLIVLTVATITAATIFLINYYSKKEPVANPKPNYDVVDETAVLINENKKPSKLETTVIDTPKTSSIDSTVVSDAEIQKKTKEKNNSKILVEYIEWDEINPTEEGFRKDTPTEISSVIDYVGEDGDNTHYTLTYRPKRNLILTFRDKTSQQLIYHYDSNFDGKLDHIGYYDNGFQKIDINTLSEEDRQIHIARFEKGCFELINNYDSKF